MVSILSHSQDTLPQPPPLPLPKTYQSVLYALTCLAQTSLHSCSFANIAYHMNTPPALVHFLHWACFSPIVNTWYKATDAGFFTTWPGLTSRLVCKHLPKYTETANGHLRLTRQHVCLTRTPPPPPLPPPPLPIQKPIMTEGTLHTDNFARENLVCTRTV